MRYLIGYVLPAPARDEHIALVAEIATRFGIQPEYEKIAPHLTLKSPFNTDDIAPVEAFLESFAKSYRAAPLMLSGFGQFRRDVVFVEARVPKETLELLSAFTNGLSRVSGTALSPHDTERKLHATLARGVGRKFDALWRYVNTQTFHFDTLLDNISILQYPGNYPWQLYRRFDLIR